MNYIDNDNIDDIIKTLISTNVSIFVPEVTITDINLVKYEDNNTINITVQYRINISGKADQITVEFI